jgi:phosphoglycerol transferase MdoB-like AlkP superfamily enzyme
VNKPLNVIWLWLGIVALIIGILYSVQTWRFPDKDLSRRQIRGAQGDSTFIVVLGAVFIALGFYL